MSPRRAETGTGVLFRHFGFGEGYAEIDLAHTAQTWALIMDRLGRLYRQRQPAAVLPGRRVVTARRRARRSRAGGPTMAVDVRPEVLVHRPRAEVAAFMFDPPTT